MRGPRRRIRCGWRRPGMRAFGFRTTRRHGLYDVVCAERGVFWALGAGSARGPGLCFWAALHSPGVASAGIWGWICFTRRHERHGGEGMSAVCTCSNPKPVTNERCAEPYCANCGAWWVPEHGSQQPYPTFEEMQARKPKPNKHGPCPCGSGKIYKKCCMKGAQS